MPAQPNANLRTFDPQKGGREVSGQTDFVNDEF